MIIGMDFGTTNSGMALYDGRRLTPLPFGSTQAERTLDRTALYVTNGQEITIGRAAIDRYRKHNLGRPVRIERVQIGVISFTGAEIGTYWEDVFAERDVLSPGRLFLSFKSALASPGYRGTLIGGLRYELEDIIAAYLHVAKLRAERALGRELRQIVLGRPVHFSTNAEEDALAQQRLVEAAFRAGYETVYLQYEPVAVAFNYERSLNREQHVLVFDFGGGTLDVTVMRVGDPQRRRVLATGGIPVAGDVFDQRIVRSKMAQRLGEGSSFGPPRKRRSVPSWIYDEISNWQTLALLQSSRNTALLNEVLAGAEQREKIEALVQLVLHNYGLLMFDAVEQAKRVLSDAPEAAIAFSAPKLAIREPITRREFELLINQDVRAVDQLLDTVLGDAGLAPAEIDRVVRTGGSSQIPVFVELLRRKFGPEKVQAVDTFSSVTAGLGVLGHAIATGEASAEAHHRQPGAPALEEGAIDPAFLRRWIFVQERAADQPDTPRLQLVRLARDGQVLLTALPNDLNAGQPLAQAANGALPSNQALLAEPDEQLLLTTSSYRLLLTTPRRLGVLDELELRLGQLEQFGPGERICTLGRWSDIQQGLLLAVATNQGAIRLLELAKIKDALERSLPVKLEPRPEGHPVAALGIRQGQELVIVTSAARAGRLRLGIAAMPGLQALKCDKGEAVVGLFPARAGEELALAAADGTLRQAPLEHIPPQAQPGSRGKALVSRLEVQAAAVRAPDAALWAITSNTLRPAAVRQGRGKLALEPEERVGGLITVV
jgi:hypothetical chaperone protein